MELANRVSPTPGAVSDPSLVTAGHYLCDPREMVWQRRATGGRSDNCSPLDQRIHPFHECLMIRRGERAQRRGCRKTSVFLSRETGISGNFVSRIKGAKCPFDLQFLKWDFS